MYFTIFTDLMCVYEQTSYVLNIIFQYSCEIIFSTFKIRIFFIQNFWVEGHNVWVAPISLILRGGGGRSTVPIPPESAPLMDGNHYSGYVYDKTAFLHMYICVF